MARFRLAAALLLVLAGAAAAFGVATCSSPPPAGLAIAITSPMDGAVVGLRQAVSGTASDPSVAIHLLVHPVNAGHWWVQPPPLPTKSDGTWTGRVYVGTETQGIGEEFEILAITTGDRLAEGDKLALDALPRDMVRSDVVTVTRGR